jgi:hypothetical protein
VFNDQKDIFRYNVLVEKGRKVHFPLTPGADTPVPLFEFELRALFDEATATSGCKWWVRRSRPSHAALNVSSFLHTVSFRCRHYEKMYAKQEVDNSRTSRHLLRCGCTAYMHNEASLFTQKECF